MSIPLPPGPGGSGGDVDPTIPIPPPPPPESQRKVPDGGPTQVGQPPPHHLQQNHMPQPHQSQPPHHQQPLPPQQKPPSGIPGVPPQAMAGLKKSFAIPQTAQEVLDCGEVLYEDDQNDDSIPQIQKITKKNNILPVWGNTHSMNLNSLVLENVVSSPYYKTYLCEVKTHYGLIDEIYYNVSHLEPWERGTRRTTGQTGMCGGVSDKGNVCHYFSEKIPTALNMMHNTDAVELLKVRGVGAGGVVSTAYCILYKLFNLKQTRKQLVGLINYYGSPYVRGLGFMYIRYCQPPSDLWTWLEPYLEDEEEIDPRAGGGDKITIGQMCKLLLTKLDWYGTLFPRIPVPIQKIIENNFRRRAAESTAEEAFARAQTVELEEAERKERELERIKNDTETKRSRSREREREKDSRDRRDRSRDRRRSPDRKRSRSRSRSAQRSRRGSPDRKRVRRSRSPDIEKRGGRRSRSRSPSKKEKSDIKSTEAKTREKRKAGKKHPKGSHHHCRRKNDKHNHHKHKTHSRSKEARKPNRDKEGQNEERKKSSANRSP